MISALLIEKHFDFIPISKVHKRVVNPHFLDPFGPDQLPVPGGKDLHRYFRNPESNGLSVFDFTFGEQLFVHVKVRFFWSRIEGQTYWSALELGPAGHFWERKVLEAEAQNEVRLFFKNFYFEIVKVFVVVDIVNLLFIFLKFYAEK